MIYELRRAAKIDQPNFHSNLIDSAIPGKLSRVYQ